MQVSGPETTTPARPRAHTAEPPGGRAAWIAWGVAASAYLVDLAHRMSLGVAALDAEGRLGVGAGAITILASVQIAVYVLGQIPAGLLADRLGPRRTLALGLLVMSAGEALFAVSDSFGLSVLGRILIGAGDATIFLSVLRVAASWFPRRQFGLVTALTAGMGCLGQLVTTVPLTASLHTLGWTATFGGGAAITVLVAGVILLVVRDRPPGVPAPARHEHPPIFAGLRRAWSKPTTRRGCLTHFALMAPFAALSTLWGHPYLVEAGGLSDEAASALLLVGVLATGLAAPVVGLLMAHRRGLRGRLAAGISLTVTVAAAALMLVVNTAPPVAIALLLALIALGMPGSMLGFDFAREGDDGHDSAATAALVNMGGWSGTVFLQIALALANAITTGPWMLAPLVLVSAGSSVALVACTDWRGALRRARTRAVPARAAV